MNTQPVSLNISAGSITVRVPFNEDFVAKAKRVGGRWNGDQRAWIFDERDQQRVRDLCFDVYGQDGIRSDLCSVEVVFEAGDSNCCGPLTVCGRTIARARGRDSGATLGDGVVCLKGGFSSGGSMKNWTTQTRNGATVLIRDFPRAIAESVLKEGETDPDQRWLTRIVPEEQPMDTVALVAEKAALVARLEAIEAQLGTAAATA